MKDKYYELSILTNNSLMPYAIVKNPIFNNGVVYARQVAAFIRFNEEGPCYQKCEEREIYAGGGHYILKKVKSPE